MSAFVSDKKRDDLQVSLFSAWGLSVSHFSLRRKGKCREERRGGENCSLSTLLRKREEEGRPYKGLVSHKEAIEQRRALRQ